MFKKKPTQPDTDRLGRQRQPRVAERGNASVFSYHASRSLRPGTTGRVDSQAATAARQEQRPAIVAHRVPVIGVGVVLLFAVLCNLYVGGSPRVDIQPTIEGANTDVPLRQPDAYSVAVRRAFAGSPLNKNKLTINTQRISDSLRSQFPEVARVDVSVPFIGASPVAHITLASPQLLLNSNSILYIVDGSGRALLQASQVPAIDKLDLPVITDQSGLSVTVGRAALPASDVAFITEVIGQLRAKGLTVTSSVLPAGTSEMDIHLSGVGYMAKFSLQGNGRVEAGAFLAVKAQLEQEHKTPAEYIDVRVEERAYYK